MREGWDVPSLIAGIFFMAIGVIFLFDQLDVWQADARYVWPVALVVLGLGILFTTRSEER